MAITQDIDVNELNSIIKKSLISVKSKDSELLDKKAIVKVSNTFTSLQNSFNKIYTYTLNVKNIQKMEERRLQNIKKEVAMETKLSTTMGAVGEAEITASLPDLLKYLTKSVTDLNKQIEELDLTSKACACSMMDDDSGVADIDDDDTRRRKKKRKGGARGRGRARTGRSMRIGGRLLGAAGALIDVIGRVDEGQSAGQIAAGVGGGIAGGAAGAAAGAALGALGGPAAPITVPLGGLIGGAVGYFGGSALGDTIYKKVTGPEPLGSTSFSSRFADYINQSITNMTSWAGSAKSILTDLTIGGGNIVGRMLDLDVGVGKGSSENAEKAMKYFISQGWTREQAAGIVGNLQNESGAGLDPNAFRANDAGPGLHSRGIAQWNRDRLANLNAYAQKNKKPWNDLQTQLEFIQWELNNSESGAGKRLRAATTVDDAAIAMTHYERFAGYQAGLANANTRQRVANARALVSFGSIEGAKRTGGTGVLTSGMKWRSYGYHPGADVGVMGNKQGTPIYAIDKGKVIYAGWGRQGTGFGGYGNVVAITHTEGELKGLTTLYGHLLAVNPNLKVGATIEGGALLGGMGNTGFSKGTHLHFELRRRATHRPENEAEALDSVALYNANKWIVGGKEVPKPQAKPGDDMWHKGLRKNPIPSSPPPPPPPAIRFPYAAPTPPPKFSFTGSKLFIDAQTR